MQISLIANPDAPFYRLVVNRVLRAPADVRVLRGLRAAPATGTFTLAAGHTYAINVIVNGVTTAPYGMLFNVEANGTAIGYASSNIVGGYNSATSFLTYQAAASTAITIVNATGGTVNALNSSISIIELA